MLPKVKKYLMNYLVAKDTKRINDKYADPNVVQKHPDRTGNKDDIYTGSKVKEFNRSANRYGNDQEDSEKEYREYNDGDNAQQDGQYGKPYVYAQEAFDALEDGTGTYRFILLEAGRLTPKQRAQRAQIIQGLMKSSGEEYRKRYGARWKQVIIGQATKRVLGETLEDDTLANQIFNEEKFIGYKKLAKKVYECLQEEFNTDFSLLDILQLSVINEEEPEIEGLNLEKAKKIVEFYEVLNDENKEKFEYMLNEDIEVTLGMIEDNK